MSKIKAEREKEFVERILDLICLLNDFPVTEGTKYVLVKKTRDGHEYEF